MNPIKANRSSSQDIQFNPKQLFMPVLDRYQVLRNDGHKISEPHSMGQPHMGPSEDPSNQKRDDDEEGKEGPEHELNFADDSVPRDHGEQHE